MTNAPIPGGMPTTPSPMQVSFIPPARPYPKRPQRRLLHPADIQKCKVPAFIQPDGEVDSISDALARQQETLLLLKHSSRCMHSPCGMAPECRRIRHLLWHVHTCVDGNCGVRDCTNVQNLISHFASCKHVDCQVCAPTRDALVRSDAFQAFQRGKRARGRSGG